MTEQLAARDKPVIFAVSSGTVPAGVAVVRVSGPAAGDALRLVTGTGPIAERKAQVRTLADISTGDQIDQALVLWFPAPHSYTGENSVEFQIHGGRAVTAALLAALGRIPGFRPAEPGEFTRRAVENGRLDLTRAEAIADLIAAETEAQRKAALRQFQGALAHLYQDWRVRLIRAAGWIEANIDFADEELPAGVWEESRRQLVNLVSGMRSELAGGRRGEIIREGFQVAVIGPPNAGKSSLVNALARRDVAIVSEQPGTTRDIIETRLDLAGYAVVLADTAGLRDSSDVVEQEGIRRARNRAAEADFTMLVSDAAEGVRPELGIKADLEVWNKADLIAHRIPGRTYISAKTGEGLGELVELLSRAASEQVGGEPPLLTRTRHLYSVTEAVQAIEAALNESEPELVAEQIRIALRALGRITGAVDLDDLLDVVFRDFCIGK